MIPTMIAVIIADDTYDSIYGVGYFGLRKFTGVEYDESHDGDDEWRVGRMHVRYDAEPRAGDIRRSVPDIERIRTILGYQPTVGVKEGLQRLLRHVRGA